MTITPLNIYLSFRVPADFPGGSDGKVSAYNGGDQGSIPGLGRSPGEGKGYPLQCSGLENPVNPRGRKESARLSDLHSLTQGHSVIQNGLTVFTK